MSYPKYEHEGYKYEPREEVEYGEEGPENIKIFHDVQTPNGRWISIDWSPYSIPTLDDFKLWIQLGRPDRSALNQGGSLNRDDLEKLAKMWFQEHFGY